MLLLRLHELKACKMVGPSSWPAPLACTWHVFPVIVNHGLGFLRAEADEEDEVLFAKKPGLSSDDVPNTGAEARMNLRAEDKRTIFRVQQTTRKDLRELT